MGLIKRMKKFVSNSDQSTQMALEIREGIANNHEVLNKILDSLNHQSALIERLQRVQSVTEGHSNRADNEDALKRARYEGRSLVIAPKTYNSAHPDYDVNVVRNYPGRVFNLMSEVSNPVYNELKKLLSNDQILDTEWDAILQETLAEVKSIPNSEQIFQRMEFAESYFRDLQN